MTNDELRDFLAARVDELADAAYLEYQNPEYVSGFAQAILESIRVIEKVNLPDG